MAAAGIAAGLLLSGSRVLAQASQPPAGPPPSWGALVHCADLAEDDDQLTCFRAAMKDAGYRPSPAVASAQRKSFGASSTVRHKDKQEGRVVAAPPAETGDKDRVTVTLAEVAVIPPSNKLLLITSDGAIWEQIDTEKVEPFPSAGQTMEVRRNRFGGFFCAFDKRNAVRCERTR